MSSRREQLGALVAQGRRRERQTATALAAAIAAPVEGQFVLPARAELVVWSASLVSGDTLALAVTTPSPRSLYAPDGLPASYPHPLGFFEKGTTVTPQAGFTLGVRLFGKVYAVASAGGGGGPTCAYPLDAPPAEVTDSGTSPMTLSNGSQTLTCTLTGTPNHEFEAYPAGLWANRATVGGNYFTPTDEVLAVQLQMDSFPKHPGGSSGYGVAYRLNLAFINFALNNRVFVCAEATDDGRCYPSLRYGAGSYAWEALGWVDDIADMVLYHDPVVDRWGIAAITEDSSVLTDEDYGYVAVLNGYGMTGDMYVFFELQESTAAAGTSGAEPQVTILTDSFTVSLDGTVSPVCSAIA